MNVAIAFGDKFPSLGNLEDLSITGEALYLLSGNGTFNQTARNRETRRVAPYQIVRASFPSLVPVEFGNHSCHSGRYYQFSEAENYRSTPQEFSVIPRR